MKVLTPDDLLRRLEQDVLRSTAGPRDLPERQQTMNATVAWSYQLLSPVEQRAFRRFGALPGRFSIDAAAAVIAGRDGAPAARDETLAALAGLIDKSLLLRIETPIAARPLFQMFETVRTYAARELSAAGERDDAMEGLARYCIERGRSRRRGPGRARTGRVAESRLSRARDLSRRAAVAHRTRPAFRSVRHRMGPAVLLVHSWAYSRRAVVVRTDAQRNPRFHPQPERGRSLERG